MDVENAIEIERHNGKMFGIVLRESQPGDRREFATHEFRVSDPTHTYWGHYFCDEMEARDDFKERVSKVCDL